MFDRLRETWQALTYREHNKTGIRMKSALKNGRVKDKSDIVYVDITDKSSVEEMRELCLSEHIDRLGGCPFPDICCHVGAINSFFDSVNMQGEELKNLRDAMEGK